MKVQVQVKVQAQVKRLQVQVKVQFNLSEATIQLLHSAEDDNDLSFQNPSKGMFFIIVSLFHNFLGNDNVKIILMSCHSSFQQKIYVKTVS